MHVWEIRLVSGARAVIVEAHPFYRHGLAKLLTASGVVVVGEAAANGWTAVKAAKKIPADIRALASTGTRPTSCCASPRPGG